MAVFSRHNVERVTVADSEPALALGSEVQMHYDTW